MCFVFRKSRKWYQNYYQTNSKQMEMFEISDSDPVIGTEVFDPSLPSNLDFEEKQQAMTQRVPFNPEKIAGLGKVILLGNKVQSFRVIGKPHAQPEPQYYRGAVVNSPIHTFSAKVFDEQGSGLMKYWQTLVGYSKRQVTILQGHIYFFQPRKEGLFLYQIFPLHRLFKIFVDPQEDKMRLIFRQDDKLLNKDVGPESLIVFLQQLNQEITRIGLGLQE